MKRIIIFRFYDNIEVCKNKLELIKKLNPNINIYGLYGGEEKNVNMFRHLFKYFADFYIIKGRTSFWRWKNCDLNVREWYKDIGRNIDFDMAHIVDWDLLLCDSIDNIYKKIPSNCVGLTCPRVIEKDSKWMWVAEEPHKSEWEELLNFVKKNYGYNKEPLSTLGPGSCFPKDFFERYIEIKVPDLSTEEIRNPLFSQIFGFEICDTEFFDNSKPENSKFFNCAGEIMKIDIEIIKEELKKKNGCRVFHPFRDVFDLSILDNH